MKKFVLAGLWLVLASLLMVSGLSAFAFPDQAHTQTGWCIGETGCGHGRQEPRVFALNPDVLASNRRALRHDAALQASLKQLTRQADGMLNAQTVSVTEKTQLPPGETDIHNYVSLALYWWPNPNTPDGLPYIRKDGLVNPQAVCAPGPNCQYPDKYLFQSVLEPDVSTLSLAYYFTGDERYAARAADFLRVWFLDSATAMNPNADHGQMTLGISSGNAQGIIDLRGMMQIVDAIGLLEGSRAWTRADQLGMQQWFSQYLNWLLTSPIGQEEGSASNNHGTWYDAQAVSFALFTGQNDLARSILQAAGNKHFDAAHLLADGEQPLELARTRPWHYSVFNLQAFGLLAMLGQNSGVNLWSFKNALGAGLQTALQFVLPAALDPASWTYQEVVPLAPGDLVEPLYQAAIGYHSSAYLDAARTIQGSSAQTSLYNLLYGIGCA